MLESAKSQEAKEKSQEQEKLRNQQALLKRRLGIPQATILPSHITPQRIEFLVNEVRDHGFNRVASSLSPTLKNVLFKACKSKGISFVGKELADKKRSQALYKRQARKAQDIADRKNEEKTLFGGDSLLKRFSASTPITKLNEEKRKGIEKNQSYLTFVLDRTEKRAFEKYYDQLREQIKQADMQEKLGKPLTFEQKKAKEMQEKLGLCADKTKENPSEKQRYHRNLITLSQLPSDIKKQMQADKNRYKEICFTKNASLELATAIFTKEICQGCHKNHSPQDLLNKSLDFIPRGKDRTIESMKACRKGLKEVIKTEKENIIELKNEKKERIAAKLEKVMTFGQGRQKNNTSQRDVSQARKTPEPPQPKRKSFLNDPVMQEVLRKRQMVR